MQKCPLRTKRGGVQAGTGRGQQNGRGEMERVSDRHDKLGGTSVGGEVFYAEHEDDKKRTEEGDFVWVQSLLKYKAGAQ